MAAFRIAKHERYRRIQSRCVDENQSSARLLLERGAQLGSGECEWGRHFWICAIADITNIRLRRCPSYICMYLWEEEEEVVVDVAAYIHHIFGGTEKLHDVGAENWQGDKAARGKTIFFFRGALFHCWDASFCWGNNTSRRERGCFCPKFEEWTEEYDIDE